MVSCPSCGRENPEGFQFCGFCTAPLTEQPSAAVQEERKVVSVLFCDLVGFTAASDAADPEDVRARIRPYHQRLRPEIERHGGTVEKFVGDAVMAVFGAPVAHEDDAERAVRAGLRILEAIEELNEADPRLSLQVRVGIDTGEAVVALGARPEQGEGIVTGDVVNTASRLQGAAPVNGVAVGEQTYRPTERIFDYEELEPVSVKGKAEPLALCRPLRARARFGTDVTRSHTTPLVGRELEKTLLIGTLERSAQQRSCQLVTVVGEPGVGKSRLCAELFALHRGAPGPGPLAAGPLSALRGGDRLLGAGRDRQGRVRHPRVGLAGRRRAAKLERGAARGRPGPAWLRARLAPLVGAAAEPVSQEESFTAWRRFLESLAADGPAVLVFEDLHWADTALLAFLEHLADWAEGVPLLLLCTARPELYERQPSFGADARNAQRINLAPLSDEETARLIGVAHASGRCCRRRRSGPCWSGRAATRCTRRSSCACWPTAAGSEESRCRRVGAGADRRPPGHALPRAQEPAAGRRRGGEGVLGRCPGGDGRPRAARGGARLARAGPQRARPAQPQLVDGGGGRVRVLARCSCATSATGRSRAPPAPTAIGRRPPGSSGRRASARRTWPTCSPTTT